MYKPMISRFKQLLKIYRKETTYRFSRSVLVDTYNKDISPSVQSKVDLKSFIGQEVNIGDPESKYVGDIVWTNKRGIYAMYVSLSRLIAKYIVDDKFRTEFLSDPSRYRLISYNLTAQPQDIFVFDELGDRQVHEFGFTPQNIGTEHYLIQKGTLIEDEGDGPLYINPETIINILNKLKDNDTEMTLRLIMVIFEPQQQEIFDQLARDITREGVVPPNLLDLTKSVMSISNKDPVILEDLIARRFSLLLVMEDFLPSILYESKRYSESMERQILNNNGLPEPNETVIQEFSKRLRELSDELYIEKKVK
jgi:hypothetical protein